MVEPRLPLVRWQRSCRPGATAKPHVRVAREALRRDAESGKRGPRELASLVGRRCYRALWPQRLRSPGVGERAGLLERSSSPSSAKVPRLFPDWSPAVPAVHRPWRPLSTAVSSGCRAEARGQLMLRLRELARVG